MATSLRRAVLAGVAALVAQAAVGALPSDANVDVDVVVRLTDLHYAPIAGVALRVIAGDDTERARADAGATATTDARGEIAVELRARIGRADGSNRVATLPLAIEAPYGVRRWRFAFDVQRRSDGAASAERLAILARDPSGAFTRRATRTATGWRMPDLPGETLTLPGYLPWHVALAPVHGRWRAEIGFVKAPETPLR